MENNLERHLNDMLEQTKEQFQELKAEALADVKIDEFDLDAESIRTPILHSNWLGKLGDQAVVLKRFQSTQKKLYLERWKYWTGQQTDKYYAEYGVVHNKILKTDVDKFLNADKYLILMSEIMEVQGQVVDFLEKTVKEISSRGFHLRAAIDWRRFQAGA